MRVWTFPKYRCSMKFFLMKLIMELQQPNHSTGLESQHHKHTTWINERQKSREEDSCPPSLWKPGSLKCVCLYVTISTPDTHSFEDVGLTCTPVAYARPSKKDSAPGDNIGVLGKITFVLGLKSQPLLFSVFSNCLSSSSEDFSFLGFILGIWFQNRC